MGRSSWTQRHQSCFRDLWGCGTGAVGMPKQGGVAQGHGPHGGQAGGPTQGLSQPGMGVEREQQGRALGLS